MASGLTLLTENLIGVTRAGDNAIIRINPVTATEGSTIIFEGGQVKWGLPVGIDGKEVELSSTDTLIRWRYVGDVTWNTLMDIAALNQGEDGLSAYEVAVVEGFEGTVNEWLDSLISSGAASAIAYDNSTSGLLGENIQDVVDEVAEFLTNSWVAPNYTTVGLPAGADDGHIAFDIDTEHLKVSIDSVWETLALASDLSGFASASHNHAATEITSGTLAVARGGTGIASYTTNNYIRASGATTLEQRTPANVLSDIGAAAASHAHSATEVTSGTLAVARGGTGIASYTTNNYIRASGATTLQQRTPAEVLSDIGAAAASHNHAATEVTSGTLAVARGGTGIASYTTNNYIRASGATTLQQRTPAEVLSDIGAAASSHNHDSTYFTETESDARFMVVVSHGSTAGTARPAGATAVYWLGTVEPENGEEGDLWLDPEA